MATTLKRLAQLSAMCLTVALFAAGFGKAVMAAADDAGKTTFESNCSVCHGEDGSGDTAVGTSLAIPDLRSDEVQKLSDEVLIGVVTNGKDPMPSFKDKLTADEIKGVVGYVRQLGKKK